MNYNSLLQLKTIPWPDLGGVPLPSERTTSVVICSGVTHLASVHTANIPVSGLYTNPEATNQRLELTKCSFATNHVNVVKILKVTADSQYRQD